MYVLTISIIRENNIDSPFFNIEPDFRWAYAASNDRFLLERFKEKIQSFTNPSYLPWMPIEILDYNDLNNSEIESNYLNRPFDLDTFYVCGIVNENRGPKYTIDQLLPDHWISSFDPNHPEYNSFNSYRN